MKERQRSFWSDTLRTFVIAAVLLVGIQSFLFHPFRIPSESMLPNLMVGDYVYTTKFTYGYSRYSFPLSLPLFSGRLFGALPQRGDVVVFRLPRDDSKDYIKRVIGLPGDAVQMIGGVLHINGQAVPRRRIEEFVIDIEGAQARAAQFLETLPNGVQHRTLDLQSDGPGDDSQVYRVPNGHLFMMGDNRDDSTDSRVLPAVGYVPLENVVGRAQLIFLSVAEDASAWAFWRWPWTLRTERVFTWVR